MYFMDLICMPFNLTQQELHALLMTSFDLKMRPHHTQTTSEYSTYQEAFIALWNGKSHFSRHSSRTLLLLTGNQAGLHCSLHLAASNPQFTANFMMNHVRRLPRTPFIHDTFSAHYLFLVFYFFCLSRSHSTFLLTTTLDIRCFFDWLVFIALGSGECCGSQELLVIHAFCVSLSHLERRCFWKLTIVEFGPRHVHFLDKALIA